MDSIKNRAAMRLLFLLCLGRALGVVVHSDAADDGEVFGRKSYALINKHNPNMGDDKMIRRIEEEMLALNKSGELPRDKRALGILLQGFMEALGYTIDPIQIASLPNPTPAAPMPAPAPAPAVPPAGMARQTAPMPPPMMPPPGPAPAAPPAPPPRQRETLRFTGVVNFGNNANTSNLVSHLAQYETLFHGNGTAQPAAPQPAPAPAANIDPRTQPLPEPLFVKIPLPIAPNLPPPQPPSPMPIQNTYHEEFTKDHAEEYQGSKEDKDEHGDYEEENDKSQHREEYANDHEQYDEPEDRNYDNNESEESYEKPPPPSEKNTEKEYKKNENVVNYSVENKEIHDPSEVSEEAPIVGSKYGHKMYVGEPNWKQEHEDHLYKLMLEQEAKAEALAEVNSERERDRSREHELDEDDVKFSRDREKEISDSNEEREAEYHAKSKEQPYYNDDDEEDDESSEKEGYTDQSDHKDEDDYEEESESKISEKPTGDSQQKEASEHEEASQHKEASENEEASQHKEAATPPPKANQVTKKPEIRRYEEYTDNDERKPYDYGKNYYDYDEGKEGKHYTTLPISYDREKSRKGDTLRDSYGKSLEKPNGKVDERIADYFTMFKNPETGVYDPSRIQQYGNSRVPYDHTDLVNGFKRIQKEYGRPESKYEEYEIKDDDDDTAQHRADYEQERNENESRKSSKEISSERVTTPDCDCSTGKSDVQSDEARRHDKLVTTGSPKPSEAPVGYGPYYSTVKHLHEPLDYDQSIIARLTSYGPPTTVRFQERADFLRSPSHTIIEKQTTARPTEIPLPEKLTTKSLLHETGTKEIRAWPAPFDYVFDNSERSDTIIKATPHPLETAANNRAPTHKTPFEPTRPDCNQEAHTLPPGKFADKVQVLLKNHGNERHSVESNKRRQNQRRPQNFRGRKIKQSGQQTTRVSSYSSVPTTQATLFEQRKRPSFTTTKSKNRHERNRVSTYPPIIAETRTPHPQKVLSTDDRKSPKRNEQRTRASTESRQTVTSKPASKENYDDYPPLRELNSKEESSNYVEKDGMLIIPEPTPYYYNEKIDDFTDEPTSDTEKVKIKEYRNRIASVKVSELKQLHPEGSMQIVKYTRHL